MKTHPGEQFAEVVLDLGDHPPGPGPGHGLILGASVADERGVARPAAGPGEQILNLPHQDVVRREALG
jgi:hypothetical protein